MVKGKIFDIKQFAVHDGPGIRTTVFFKGCPLNCWWCHNPEGISRDNDIFFYETKCIECGKCIEICPEGAITQKDIIVIDREKCTFCGICAGNCPSGALQNTSRTVTAEEVMEEIRKSIIFYDSSDGGVTFSGGEPLLQIKFLKELIDRCIEEDIHVTLDTSGHIDPETFESIVDDIDLFLYDLKIMDNKLHKKYTGTSNDKILKNLKLLSKKGKEVIIRFPLIPGITDTDKNIDEIIDFLSDLKNVKEIDILPYHNVEEKYKRLGREYKITELRSPDESKIDSIKKRFEKEGFFVKEGG
ncbi:MAG: glycyl-radical enzyme activating protein [Thermoplasmata archaeon]